MSSDSNTEKTSIPITTDAETKSPITAAILADAKSGISPVDVDPHIIDNPDVEKFGKYPIKRKKIKSSLLRFNFFYKITSLKIKVICAATIGLITALISVIFVQSTGLYTGGTSAFFQGFARMIYTILEINIPSSHDGNIVVFNVIYWFLYLLMNVFLGWFAYKKIGKEFAIISFVYILTTQVLGFLFGTLFEMTNVQINIFGVTNTIDPNLQNIGAKCIYFDPQYFPSYAGGKYDWSQLYTQQQLLQLYPDYAQSIISSVRNENLVRSFSLLLYAIAYAIIISVFYAILYIIGGSSAGSDFYTVYMSRSKGKPVGKIYMLINGSFMMLGVFMGSFISPIIVDFKHYFSLNTLLSANLVASAITVVISGTLIDIFYPKDKLAEVVVYSDHFEQILTYLQNVNFPHAVSNSIVYSNNNTAHNRLITSCFYHELPKFILAIRKFDSTCVILSKMIRDIDGEVDIEEGVG